jgi:hypothetical protein
MPEEVVLRQLNLILNQTDSQNGRANIQLMFEDLRDALQGEWALNIVNTILYNIQDRNDYRVSSRQMEYLAKAIANRNFDLTQYEIANAIDSPGEAQNVIRKGIVISTITRFLRSDGQIIECNQNNFTPSQWVEFRGDVPKNSFFEIGRDETWCNKNWHLLINEFENGHVDDSALLRVSGQVRRGLIEETIHDPASSDRLRELLNTIYN